MTVLYLAITATVFTVALLGGLMYLAGVSISLPSSGFAWLGWFTSVRKWLYGAGFILLLLFYPTIIDWMAPHLAATPAFQSWNLDEQWIEANYEWVGLVLVGSVLFFFWFFPGEGNAISNRFFFGVIFAALALQIVPDQYKSFANQPNCTFKDRIGFEFGLHQVAPKTLGREGDADEWIDPLQNNNPRILNTRQGVDTILCPGDSSYVMVAPGTHLEIDFTTGFAQAKDNIRKVSLVGETGGYHIGEFVQVEYIPSNNGDPVYRLYRVHVKDSMFGDTIGTGHDWIEVTVRTVPRRF